jgi:hypothetical protein
MYSNILALAWRDLGKSEILRVAGFWAVISIQIQSMGTNYQLKHLVQLIFKPIILQSSQ